MPNNDISKLGDRLGIEKLNVIQEETAAANSLEAFKRFPKTVKTELENDKRQVLQLGKRFQTAFGFVPKKTTAAVDYDFTYKNLVDDAKVFKGGNSTWDVVTIIPPSGGKLIFGDMMAIANVGKVFAPPLMINWSRIKKIIETELDGGESVVVENYNSGQWELDIRGLLIDMDGHSFPLSKLVALDGMFEVNDILAVESELFDALNVKSIYLKSFDFSQIEGFEDTIQFTLSAKSIKPQEYFLKELMK